MENNPEEAFKSVRVLTEKVSSTTGRVSSNSFSAKSLLPVKWECTTTDKSPLTSQRDWREMDVWCSRFVPNFGSRFTADRQVHCRTKEQKGQRSGPPDWDIIRGTLLVLADSLWGFTSHNHHSFSKISKLLSPSQLLPMEEFRRSIWPEELRISFEMRELTI